MPDVLDYAPRRVRPRWAGYVLFAVPSLAIVSVRVFYLSIADFLAHYQYPSDRLAYAVHRWALEDCFIGIMFKLVGLTAILLLMLSAVAIVPKVRHWLHERVPGWSFLFIVDWLVVICVGLMPILR